MVAIVRNEMTHHFQHQKPSLVEIGPRPGRDRPDRSRFQDLAIQFDHVTWTGTQGSEPITNLPQLGTEIVIDPVIFLLDCQFQEPLASGDQARVFLGMVFPKRSAPRSRIV